MPRAKSDPNAPTLEKYIATLRDAGTPARAEQEQRYLKSSIPHFGVTVPRVRTEMRALLKALGPLDHDTLLRAADKLWDAGYHETRASAVMLLGARVSLLDASDLPRLERYLREARTWALIDEISTRVVGPIVTANPVAKKTLKRWARDKDFWVRRTSLLALLIPMREGGGDFALFEALAVPMLDEREFFIRKAIGWILRDTSRKQPDKVIAFVEAHGHECSGLTLREATRNLAEAKRVRLLKKVAANARATA